MDSQLKKDLKEFIQLIKKHKLLIMNTIIACLLASTFYSVAFSKKTYTYTSKLYLQINVNGDNLDQSIINQLKNEVTNLFLEYATDYYITKHLNEKNAENSIFQNATFEQVRSYPIIKITIKSNQLIEDNKKMDDYIRQIITDFNTIKSDVKFSVVQNFELYKVQSTNVLKNIVLGTVVGIFISLIIVVLLQLLYLIKNIDNI